MVNEVHVCTAEAHIRFHASCIEAPDSKPYFLQAEPSQAEASGGGAAAKEGMEEGLWVPEEFLEHEAAARELADESAVVAGEGKGAELDFLRA